MQRQDKNATTVTVRLAEQQTNGFLARFLPSTRHGFAPLLPGKCDVNYQYCCLTVVMNIVFLNTTSSAKNVITFL